MAGLIGQDFIELKIDVDRDLNGKALAQRLRGSEEGGIPWMVITDPAGKRIVTSDAPKETSAVQRRTLSRPGS